ncbi:MAG: imidazoleglycerol-phosphate dehydratase HisB [Spirochaetota bacterium]
MNRTGSCKRKTGETDVSVDVELLSAVSSTIETGVPFLDHMLNAVSRHGRLKLDVFCSGDTHIDDHHSVEDIGICFGKALAGALGEKRGIHRFGFGSVPMDESLSQVSIDLSGRGFFRYTGEKLSGYINTYAEELTIEFFHALAFNAAMNIHISLLYGSNRHHIHESIFKSFAIALYTASRHDDILNNAVPSTKGVI